MIFNIFSKVFFSGKVRKNYQGTVTKWREGKSPFHGWPQRIFSDLLRHPLPSLSSSLKTKEQDHPLPLMSSFLKTKKTRPSTTILVIIFKHCQRHNGPEDWVHLAKVASWSHIRSSNINLDHISSSESRLSINKKSQPNISISTKLKIQNLDQT